MLLIFFLTNRSCYKSCYNGLDTDIARHQLFIFLLLHIDRKKKKVAKCGARKTKDFFFRVSEKYLPLEAILLEVLSSIKCKYVYHKKGTVT